MCTDMLPGERRPQFADIGRRLARRSESITAPLWQARRRSPRSWANSEADLLNPDRAPEESYRDYIFRKAIWP